MVGILKDKAGRIVKRMIGDRIAAASFADGGSAANSLVAVISRSEATLAKTLERKLFCELIGSADIRCLLESGGAARFPQDSQDHGSVYLCQTPGVFDQVILDDTISPVVSAWSRAFFTHLYRLVRPGGRLVLPIWLGPESRNFGRWTVGDYTDHFGVDLEVLTGTDFIAISRDDTVPADCVSIAGWYIENAQCVLMQHAYLTATDADTRPDCMKTLALNEPDLLKEHGVAQLADRLERYTASHCYYVGGISYKAPLLSHIIQNHVKKEKGLSLIDMGGGYGLLAAELAMDPKLNFTSVVCTDISDLNGCLAAGLYADLAEHLAGRFGFACKPAQEYHYDDAYDAVCFVGSLLYVPKDQLRDTLTRAWDAVEQGGVLIVHENIKHPRFERDHDIMFTVDELDELLNRFGEIHRYASQYTQSLTQMQAGSKTVFRVVEKAA